MDLQQMFDDARSMQAEGHQKEAEELLAEAAESVCEPGECERIAQAAEDCAGRAGMLHKRRFRKIAERARERAELLERVPIV